MKALLTLALSLPLFAQSVASTPRGVLVAHDNVIELQGKWKTEGVSAPGAIAVSATRAAVLDPIHDRVAIVELTDGRTTFANTGATPIAAAFAGNDLLVVDRDANAIEKIGEGKIPLGRDPELLAVNGDRAYVYSRVDGAFQEIGIEPFELLRTIQLDRFASAMQCDAHSAYLAFPAGAHIKIVDLETMELTKDDVTIGQLPMDVAISGGPTALTASRLAVADPVAKRVWLVEGRQSTKQAFARGFLRGMLGLHPFSQTEKQFPAGIDHVLSLGAQWIAFDSSTGTLYEVTKRETIVLARGLAPHAFALTPEGVVWWQNGTLVAQKVD